MAKKDKGVYHKAPNGKNINVFVWEYIRAAKELGLQYRFITPEYDLTEKYIEIYNDQQVERFYRAVNSLNNMVAAVLAKEKRLTNNLLERENIPVPKQHIVTKLKQLDKLKNKLSYPAVVKPVGLHKGLGITSNINNYKDLKKAYKLVKSTTKKFASKISYETIGVIIEEMVSGFDHRLLVLDNRVIAAIKKYPPQVIGDGEHTVKQLINIENETPLRKKRKISTIKIDDDLKNTLRTQKLNLKSVPPDKQPVLLHHISNLSSGATTENITDKVHPDFIKIAVAATKTIGLKLAGVDIICRDISKSPRGQDHAVIEINAQPGSRLHRYPAIGEAVDVNKKILKYIFKIK